jgi:hypothetical protein
MFANKWKIFNAVVSNQISNTFPNILWAINFSDSKYSSFLKAISLRLYFKILDNAWKRVKIYINIKNSWILHILLSIWSQFNWTEIKKKWQFFVLLILKKNFAVIFFFSFSTLFWLKVYLKSYFFILKYINSFRPYGSSRNEMFSLRIITIYLAKVTLFRQIFFSFHSKPKI